MSAFISDKNDAIDYARIRLNHLFLTDFYKFDQRWSKPSCNRVTFDIYCLNDAFTSNYVPDAVSTRDFSPPAAL